MMTDADLVKMVQTPMIKPDDRAIISKIRDTQEKCDQETALMEHLNRYLGTHPNRSAMESLKMHRLYATVARSIFQQNMLLTKLRKRCSIDLGRSQEEVG